MFTDKILHLAPFNSTRGPTNKAENYICRLNLAKANSYF